MYPSLSSQVTSCSTQRKGTKIFCHLNITKIVKNKKAKQNAGTKGKLSS